MKDKERVFRAQQNQVIFQSVAKDLTKVNQDLSKSFNLKTGRASFIASENISPKKAQYSPKKDHGYLVINEYGEPVQRRLRQETPKKSNISDL